GTNDPDKLTLAWDVAREGRKPAAFRIYASDEKGFSVSDSAYEVAVGNQRERGMFPGRKTATFPANFLAAVSERRFSLRPTHAFYRVVAVDENGTRSGSSEYVAAPRPFIHSEPPRVTKVGAPVDYTPKTIASIGDLTYRDFGIGGPYQGAFWDAERPAYSFEPEYPRCGNRTATWLHLDPATGRITGTPQAADVGEWQINLKVEIPGVGVHVQSFPLDVAP
ncbi:MAG TPA: Ig domain-containing protein, partial [Opitutaceae bacterium]|nr:Ig domain-containing protein [Opitutaceae bacterium]